MFITTLILMVNITDLDRRINPSLVKMRKFPKKVADQVKQQVHSHTVANQVNKCICTFFYLNCDSLGKYFPYLKLKIHYFIIHIY